MYKKGAETIIFQLQDERRITMAFMRPLRPITYPVGTVYAELHFVARSIVGILVDSSRTMPNGLFPLLEDSISSHDGFCHGLRYVIPRLHGIWHVKSSRSTICPNALAYAA